MSDSPKHGAITGWLHLLRLPNLPTVPGDPVAGFMLARLTGQPMPLSECIPAAAAAICLYASGLISNDCADVAEDVRDRPARPLPSGAVSTSAAQAGWVALALLGLGCAFLANVQTGLFAALLLAFILLYNFAAKTTPLGTIVMGCCRGLSLLVGSAAAGWQPALDLVAVAALGTTFYVAAVTAIAERETESVSLGARRWQPSLIVLVCLGAVLLQSGRATILSYGLALVALAWAIFNGVQLAGTPAPALVGRSIGRLLRGLLLLQAAFVSLVLPEGTLIAVLLLCLWPVSAILSRRFYAS